MSTSPSLGYPAPSDRDFRIVPELEKYVVTTRTALAWRIHSHKAKTGKAYAPVFFSNAEGSRWDFQAQSSGASVVNVDGALTDIVKGRRGITADTALRLARFFQNSAEFWLNLQAEYDLRTADAKRIEAEVQPHAA